VSPRFSLDDLEERKIESARGLNEDLIFNIRLIES
jgi:hypothetical protein